MPRFDPSAFPEDTMKGIRRSLLVDSDGADLGTLPVNVAGNSFETFEGTGTGSNETKTFSAATKSVSLANDGTTDMSFKFDAADTFSTLLAGETLAVEVATLTVIINTTVAYRIWGTL